MNSNDSMQNGILVSSGLIAGESLMGIVLAFIAGFGVSSFSLNLDEGSIKCNNNYSGFSFFILVFQNF